MKRTANKTKILVFFLTFLFFACQSVQTTESSQSEVVNQETPSLSNPPISYEGAFPANYDTPIPQPNEETYAFSYTTQSIQTDLPIGKKGARCIMNFSAEVPNQKEFPVFAVQYVEWTPADIERIFHVVAAEHVLFAGSFTPDKQFYINKLKQLENSPRTAEINKGLANAGLPSLEEQIQSALEDSPKSVTDVLHNWEKYKESISAQTLLSHFYSEEPDKPFNLLFLKNVYGKQDQTLLFTASCDLIQTEELVTSGEYIGAKPGRKLNNLSITSDAAEEKAKAFLNTLGVENVILSDVSKAQRVDVFTCEVFSEGWSLTYYKQIYDLPCSSVAYQSLSAAKEDDLPGANEEAITLYIDAEGIWFFSWRNPIVISTGMQQTVSILDFDTILIKIQDALGETVARFEQNDAAIQEIRVTRVIFHYTLVRNQTDGKIVARPVWEIDYEMDALFALQTIRASFLIDAADGVQIIAE